MNGEKQKVAFSSVVAAVFLTLIKVVVGIVTGSLSILSEAAHSALDLGAAVVTFFAVRISDKPADTEHNYGHGKVESFSALIETLLLFITCAWIIYEAVKRLASGEMADLKVSETAWGIGIMILSILINTFRAKALRKAAQKYRSQALEADALHFDTDIWSSYVVIGGLICVGIGDFLNIPLLQYGDPIAALGVSVLVIIVSARLGKRTIDALLDTAPKGMVSSILHIANGVNGVLDVANVRVRASGPSYFIDISIGLARNESHRVVHSIVDEIRENIQKSIPNSDIIISTFPVDVPGMEDKEIYHTVKKIVDKFPVCTNIHNIHVYEVSWKKYISTHIEVKESMSLNESHELSHVISDMIKEAINDVEDVSVNFEYVEQQNIHAEDITEKSKYIIDNIYEQIKGIPEKPNCHDIKIYSRDEKLTVFLHCELQGDYTIEKIEQVQKSITNRIRGGISDVEGVHIHVEPLSKEE